MTVGPRRESDAKRPHEHQHFHHPHHGQRPPSPGSPSRLKGGVIMDVVTAEQAKIAEDAGAVAVMALERVPADIRAQGGVSRMSDPDMIDGHHRARSRSR